MFSGPEYYRSGSIPPTRLTGRGFAWIGWVALVTLVPIEQPTFASEPSSNDRSNIAASRKDDQILIHARNALSRFPVLKPKNLFIRIREGVATIGGEVSSPDAAKQVVQILMQVEGVYEVKNNLTVLVVKEPLIVLPGAPEAPTRTESASIDTHTGKLGLLAGRVPDPLPPSITQGQLKRNIPVKRPLPANPYPPQQAEDVDRDRPQRKASGESLIVLGSPQPTPESLRDLRQVVEQILQEDGRFQDLKIDVRDEGAILVEDNSSRPDDVTALAGRLRRIPGVRSVTVQIVDR